MIYFLFFWDILRVFIYLLNYKFCLIYCYFFVFFVLGFVLNIIEILIEIVLGFNKLLIFCRGEVVNCSEFVVVLDLIFTFFCV